MPPEIKTLETGHLSEALRLVRENHAEARSRVPVLPVPSAWPDLSVFAENGLGVSAWDGGRMLGFLGAYPPFAGAFGLPGVTGVFSPLHGHGAVPDGRAALYARMYQAAAERWVERGAASHAVCLYAHDGETVGQFFRYGFGLRCVDAIRATDPLETAPRPEAEAVCREADRDELPGLLPLVNALSGHMGRSPVFMRCPPQTAALLLEEAETEAIRYFPAWVGKSPVAYLKVSRRGEAFMTEAPDMRNIVGAYCLPAHRGGVMAALLAHATETLRAEGCGRLGVDYESFNPAASGFWRKHFTEYTHGVVRRVDESALHRAQGAAR